MKIVVLLLSCLLAACAPSKQSGKLHSVDMKNRGPEIYGFQIEYGKEVLPYGKGIDREFGGGGEFTYIQDMPLPENAIVQWRTSQDLQADAVKYVVPLRSIVTDREWNEHFFSLRFVFDQRSLQVFVQTGPASKLRERIIFSSTRRLLKAENQKMRGQTSDR